MNTSNERQLSPNQDTAINTHDHNLIVVAGAGSGKTFVLVERYLTPAGQESYVAFERGGGDHFHNRKPHKKCGIGYGRYLSSRLNTATPDTQDMWAARMGAMESARIDTIHGLCASILRANAAEVGIDPGFEVMDEVDARILLDDSIDDVLQAVAHQGWHDDTTFYGI